MPQAGGTPKTSSLFRPLVPRGVLVPDETIEYYDRRHWGAILGLFIETFFLLGLLFFVASGLLGSGSGGALAGVFVLGGLISLALMVRRRDWNTTSMALTAVGLVGVFFLFRGSIVVIAILYICLRFLYRFSMWAFFERLMITNRRILIYTGFLGAEISNMSLVRVTDILFKRSALGEVLGYGDIRVETAGQDQALSLIKYVNEPAHYYEVLINLSTTVRDPINTDVEQFEAFEDGN